MVFGFITFAGISRSDAVSFTPLGDLAGGSFSSVAFDLSADGSVVVGGSSGEAFRWTSGGGMAGLGDLPGGNDSSTAWGVSADGSVVVGRGTVMDPNDPEKSVDEASRWTSGGGMVGLGDLAGGGFFSQARGVSGDGSVVVGRGKTASGSEAFRWTSGGGMIGLGDLPGGSDSSTAWGVSGDGSVVVGQSNSASGFEAFRWTSGGGMVGLGDLLPDAPFFSQAWGVSGDGSVVVGEGTSTPGQREAFRWTSSGGMVGLGDLAGLGSTARGVSADGSVVVGSSTSASGGEAFFWDSTNGMQSISGILTSSGVDLTGWTLQLARSISDNGLTIVGSGINPSGFTEAWVAQLGEPIPEPATMALLGIGLAGLGGIYLRRRRKQRADA